VTDIYPTTFAAEQVVGDTVEVIQLTPPGVNPHTYELTPKQMQEVEDADLVAYIGGMIPAVEEAAAQQSSGKSIDVAEGITLLPGTEHDHGSEDDHDADHDHASEDDHDHDASPSAADDHDHDASADHDHDAWDPHVWLNPQNMAIMGTNIADALTEDGAEANATALQDQMNDLSEEMNTALANCAITPMVVSHEAFAYLAAAHNFQQVGIRGLTAEEEPSPARMAEITDLVRDSGVTTIYFESIVSPAASEAIARETGATTALLDGAHGNTDSLGYVRIMQNNTETLRTGQTCS
jgi:zinc transport system substrate-binding protein